MQVPVGSNVPPDADKCADVHVALVVNKHVLVPVKGVVLLDVRINVRMVVTEDVKGLAKVVVVIYVRVHVVETVVTDVEEVVTELHEYFKWNHTESYKISGRVA